MKQKIATQGDTSKARIPQLPFTEEARNVRMVFAHVINLVAYHRRRFESGEASFEQWVLLERYCPGEVEQHFAEFERVNRDPASDVSNVRYWLRECPRIVEGIELSLVDLEPRISDDEILDLVNAWCRPLAGQSEEPSIFLVGNTSPTSYPESDYLRSPSL